MQRDQKTQPAAARPVCTRNERDVTLTERTHAQEAEQQSTDEGTCGELTAQTHAEP